MQNFINHPSINKAWIAQKLYGQNTATTRSKLAQKIKGKINFTDDELVRLAIIKRELFKQL